MIMIEHVQHCSVNFVFWLTAWLGCAQVRQLQPQAVASWWQPGHPGWAIYPVDSEQFMSTGALDNVSVPNESTLVAPPPPDSPGTQAASACAGVIVRVVTPEVAASSLRCSCCSTNRIILVKN